MPNFRRSGQGHWIDEKLQFQVSRRFGWVQGKCSVAQNCKWHSLQRWLEAFQYKGRAQLVWIRSLESEAAVLIGLIWKLVWHTKGAMLNSHQKPSQLGNAEQDCSDSHITIFCFSLIFGEVPYCSEISNLLVNDRWRRQFWQQNLGAVLKKPRKDRGGSGKLIQLFNWCMYINSLVSKMKDGDITTHCRNVQLLNGEIKRV